MATEIPQIRYDDQLQPGWIACSDGNGNSRKPTIRCACGNHIGLKLHHVHADGTVTASFHHATAQELQKIGDKYFFTHKGKQYETAPGCGWHVHLKLDGYDRGDFPAEE